MKAFSAGSTSIAWKDIQILVKDRGLALQLFLLPLLFVLVFTGALGAIGSGEEKDARIPLAVVDLDSGQVAQTLMAGIDAAGGVKVELYEQAEALALAKENTIPRVLTIPQGFTDAVAAGQQITLRLINHPGADPQQTEVVRLVVEGVARDMSLEIQLFAALR